MTPCQNCDKGQKKVSMPQSDGSIEWEIDVPVICPCCGGEYENCPNCTPYGEWLQEELKKDYGWD